MSMRKWMNLGDKEKEPAKPSTPEAVEEITERYLGMENFGNTCYANSVLQALYFCRPFREQVELFNLQNQNEKTSTSSAPSSPPSSAPHSISVPPAQLSPGPTDEKEKEKTPLIWWSEWLRPPEKEGEKAQEASTSEKTLDETKTTSSASSNTNPNNTPKSTSNPTIPSAAQTQEKMEGELSEDSTILTTLRELFVEISQYPKATGAVAPKDFIACLRKENELFRSTMHQDAHEFLNYLLNTVAEEVEKHEVEKKREEEAQHRLKNVDVDAVADVESFKRPKRRKTLIQEPAAKTWVHSLFEGVLTNETRCLTCETVTSRDESFLDLSIDIEQNSSITSCLRQFSRSEMLFQKNKYDCDQCCGLQEAEKRMKIKKLPNVLALHLKRFKYQEDVGRYIKLTYRVVFPFELRLFNTADGISNPDRLYELWAVVVHVGVGPHHGHYVALVKSQNKWHLFDDNVVTVVDESEIQKYFGDTSQSGSGYVLFYNAVDTPRESPYAHVPVAHPVLSEPAPAIPVPSSPPSAFGRHQAKIRQGRPQTAPDKVEPTEPQIVPPVPQLPQPSSTPPTPLANGFTNDPLANLPPPPPIPATTPPPEKTESKGLFGTMRIPGTPKSPPTNALDTPLPPPPTDRLQKRESISWAGALTGGLRGKKSLKEVKKKKDKGKDRAKDSEREVEKPQEPEEQEYFPPQGEKKEEKQEEKEETEVLDVPVPAQSSPATIKKAQLSTDSLSQEAGRMEGFVLLSDSDVPHESTRSSSISPSAQPADLPPRPPSSSTEALSSNAELVVPSVPHFTTTPPSQSARLIDSDNVSAISSADSTNWRLSHLSVGSSNSPFVVIGKQRRESMSSAEGSVQGHRPPSSTGGSGVMQTLNSKTSGLFRKRKDKNSRKAKEKDALLPKGDGMEKKSRTTSLNVGSPPSLNDLSQLDGPTPTLEQPAPAFMTRQRPLSLSSTPIPGSPAAMSDAESVPSSPHPYHPDFHAVTEPIPSIPSSPSPGPDSDFSPTGTVKLSNSLNQNTIKLSRREVLKREKEEKRAKEKAEIRLAVEKANLKVEEGRKEAAARVEEERRKRDDDKKVKIDVKEDKDKEKEKKKGVFRRKLSLGGGRIGSR
ncbi:cysteine proteinase [Atractiella rhizophila]|nr:cysteine proteinase [Atractiella rhizophila]